MSPEVFSVEVVREHGVPVVRVSGEVDMATVPEFKAALAAVRSLQEAPDIVVDLAAVSFMDSSGLNLLVGTLRDAQARSGTVTLTNPQASVRRLLQLTGLTAAFNVPPGSPSTLDATPTNGQAESGVTLPR